MRLLEEGLVPLSSLAPDESIFRMFIVDPDGAEEVDVLVYDDEPLVDVAGDLPDGFVDELVDYLGEVWADSTLRWEKAI